MNAPCPRCGARLLRDSDELRCIMCGHIDYGPQLDAARTAVENDMIQLKGTPRSRRRTPTSGGQKL